ncbi:MAG TPA: hypothetical protein VNW95_01115 [Mucilaginibacter sp.]|jgi:hypothetical protein|nr:hypothetical protein [Mucilaginibacter sp.]
MAKKKEAKPRPEKYEKSNLSINGSFDGAMKVFFIKPKEPPKQENK